MPCKDCKKKKCNCEVIYKRIELPESYNFGIDSDPIFQILIPINEFNPEEEYFLDITSAQNVYSEYSGPGFTANPFGAVQSIVNWCSGIYPGFYNTIQDAVNFAASQDWSVCAGSYKHLVAVYIINENYGKRKSPDSDAFLSWPLKQNVYSYGELKDPFWKLNFPYCGSAGHEIDSQKFKIEGCDIVKVEYRLRLRPLVFLGWPEDGSCDDYDPASSESTESDDNLKKMWIMYRWAQSLKNQQGSKYMGLTPLRLETGIYNERSKKENPIVWSEGRYPQPVIKARGIWDSKFRNGKYLYGENCFVKKNWSGMTPNLISSSLETIENKYPEEGYYYSFGSTSSKGLFSVTNNSISSPTKIKFSTQSQKVGNIYDTNNIHYKLLEEGIYDFFSSAEYVSSSYGNIEIFQYGLIDGEWSELRKIVYSITGIQRDDSSVECKVTHISTVNTDIGNLESTTIFYNGSTIQTRYEVIPILNKKTYDVPKMSWNNIVIGNLTELTEDFVYELEGFTHINLEEAPEFSIYLKALPDHPGTTPLEINATDTLPYFYNKDLWTSNLGEIVPEVKWPWGVLSADERTGYVEQYKKIYEPFLPIRADIVDFGSTKINSITAGIDYRLGYKASDEHWSGPKINDWFIMVEEGWVRITKTCENCCDASAIKKQVPSNIIPISEESDVITFGCDGTEAECRDPYLEDGEWVGKCEGLIYMPEDYRTLDDMAIDYGGTWELEYRTSDGYDVYLFGDGSRWKNIGFTRPILCPED